jgi:hypothetical protein
MVVGGDPIAAADGRRETRARRLCNKKAGRILHPPGLTII